MGGMDDSVSAEIAALTALFMAAGAVLSNGTPVASEDLNLLRAAMFAENTPAALSASVLQKCQAGLTPADVPIYSGISRNSPPHFAARILLFALRAASRGNPVDLTVQLCAPYGATREFIEALARDLSAHPEARPSTDTAASLRLLLEPPKLLSRILESHDNSHTHRRAARRSAAHISPTRIQHPDDREATEALHDVAGLNELVNFVMKYAIEKAERVNNLGGRVLVSNNQFAELYEIYRGCVTRSGVTPEPDLYLENGTINAYTYGTDRPYIVVHSGAITLLSTPELEFLFGHELGHIRFKHVLNLTLGRVLPSIASQLPFGTMIGLGLELALFGWQRKAELSADRMGLLVSQDPDAALRMLVKLSGVPAALYPNINTDAFIAQYDNFQAIDHEVAGSVAKVLRSAYQTHPWTVVRAHELLRWVKEGEYERILWGGTKPVQSHISPGPSSANLRPFECSICGSVVPADAQMCNDCGAPCSERNRFRDCIKCEIPIKPSLRFCESCGTRQPQGTEFAK